MLEITVDARRSHSLRMAVAEAISSGDYDSLYDDIRDAFSDEQIEQIEDVIESGDLAEAIDDVVSEWGADDVDELFEALESFFAESSIELTFSDDEFEEEIVEDEVEDDDAEGSTKFEYEEDGALTGTEGFGNQVKENEEEDENDDEEDEDY